MTDKAVLQNIAETLKNPPKVPASAAQISSFAVGVEGLGNYSVNDLTGFVPGADDSKLQQTIEALSALDFTKRVPRMLFTADFSPDGLTSKGAIIGWRKMFDASGYVITRHDVFRNLDKEFKFTASELNEKQAFISEYIASWVLSFYDIEQKNVVAWLDESVDTDSYYTYTVSAYQVTSNATGTIFSVKSTPAVLTAANIKQIRNDIDFTVLNRRQITSPSRTRIVVAQINEEVDLDKISPYPQISKALYGDSSYDWLLAGVNVRAAFDRKESVETLRAYSYLGSKISFIVTQNQASKFFVPEDPAQLIKNVERSIADFGVTRTLVEILDSTGMLFFFGQKEVTPGLPDPSVANRSGLLASILSAIDPETATMNPQKLVYGFSLMTRTAGGITLATPIKTDIPIIVDSNHTSDQILADQAAQFVGDVSSDASMIDLTTYDGISRLMRTLRTYFDSVK